MPTQGGESPRQSRPVTGCWGARLQGSAGCCAPEGFARAWGPVCRRHDHVEMRVSRSPVGEVGSRFGMFKRQRTAVPTALDRALLQISPHRPGLGPSKTKSANVTQALNGRWRHGGHVADQARALQGLLPRLLREVRGLNPLNGRINGARIPRRAAGRADPSGPTRAGQPPLRRSLQGDVGHRAGGIDPSLGLSSCQSAGPSAGASGGVTPR